MFGPKSFRKLWEAQTLKWVRYEFYEGNLDGKFVPVIFFKKAGELMSKTPSGKKIVPDPTLKSIRPGVIYMLKLQYDPEEDHYVADGVAWETPEFWYALFSGKVVLATKIANSSIISTPTKVSEIVSNYKTFCNAEDYSDVKAHFGSMCDWESIQIEMEKSNNIALESRLEVHIGLTDNVRKALSDSPIVRESVLIPILEKLEKDEEYKETLRQNVNTLESEIYRRKKDTETVYERLREATSILNKVSADAESERRTYKQQIQNLENTIRDLESELYSALSNLSNQPSTAKSHNGNLNVWDIIDADPSEDKTVILSKIKKAVILYHPDKTAMAGPILQEQALVITRMLLDLKQQLS